MTATELTVRVFLEAHPEQLGWVRRCESPEGDAFFEFDGRAWAAFHGWLHAEGMAGVGLAVVPVKTLGGI